MKSTPIQGMFDGKPIANFKVMADTEAVVAKRTETKKKN